MASMYEDLRRTARAVAGYQGPAACGEIAELFRTYLDNLQRGRRITDGEHRALWRMVDPDVQTALSPPGGMLAVAVEDVRAPGA